MLILWPPVDVDAEIGYPSLRQTLMHLDGTWEVRVRRHPSERRPQLALAAALSRDPELLARGVRIGEEAPSEIGLVDALRRTRVVVSTTSAAMIDAWVAGCKIVHLTGISHRATLMDRYGGSPNALYAENQTELSRFLASPAVLDDEESERVRRLTLIDTVPSQARVA
jgi:hypothetical protein